jgi:protein gp37
MGDKSKIEWTDATWNPVTGCTVISPGCDNCYARAMARRLQAMGSPRYRDGFKVRTHPDILDRPVRWTKPRMVFVCSMSDLFHDDVPDEFIRQVFSTMRAATRHTFQVLTKRPDRARYLVSALGGAPPNVWMGTTVEDFIRRSRIPKLQQIPARVRFLSLEPLLSPIHDLDLKGIDWVIVGGESGPKARPMDPKWVRDIRDQCLRAGVSFFFKQWGGINKKKAGRILDGRTWDELPHRR